MCAFVQYLFFYTDRKIIDYSRSYHSTHPSLHALQTLSMLSLIPRSWNSEMQTNIYNQHRNCLQSTNLHLLTFSFFYNVQLLLRLCVFFPTLVHQSQYSMSRSVFSVKVSIQCQGQHSVSRSAFNVIIQCQGQHSVSRSALIVKVSIPYQGQHSVSACSIKVSIQCQGQHSVLMTTFSVKVTISVKVFDQCQGQHSISRSVSR